MLPNILAAGIDLNPILPFLSPIVSVLAAIAAGIAARFAWLQKQTEMGRTLRSQMSDAVSRTYIAEKELMDIEAELDLLPRGEAESEAAKKKTYLRSKRIIIRDQCYLITHQAAYVLQQSLGRKELPLNRKTELKDLLEKFRFSHVEYAAIARGFGMGGDPQAREYWKLVLEASSGLPQALYRREFSKFLFSTNEFDEGRKQFTAAVDSLKTLNSRVGNSDSYLWELMWTDFEWARQEKKKASDPKNASTRFKFAVETIRKLRNEERKNNARDIVREQWTSIFPDKSLPEEFHKI